jgi:hypothetical protein
MFGRMKYFANTHTHTHTVRLRSRPPSFFIKRRKGTAIFSHIKEAQAANRICTDCCLRFSVFVPLQ